MIRREKQFELMEFFLKTHLNTFGSKVLLTLKIMDFENVPLIKVVHIYVIDDCIWLIFAMFISIFLILSLVLHKVEYKLC